MHFRKFVRGWTLKKKINDDSGPQSLCHFEILKF